MAETNETIIVPAFLASDDSTISLMDLGGYCGEAGCCTTECSQYCMSCTSVQGGGCGESCSESCGEVCTGQVCGEGGCCTTECSQYCMASQGCGETCDAAQTCGAVQVCGETQAPPPSDPWSWTTAELNAFNNNGNFSVLTAYRWNQFCDKINATCVAAGESWLTNYTTLSGAKASGPGAPLTALMFMSVKFNIGSRVPTYPPIPATINTDDTVYGWYFITLQEKLNEWIARL